jgi:hypothetical protein
MSWRETLGVTPSTETPYTHNSQNAQKPAEPGNCADIADSAYRGSEQESSKLLKALTDACRGLDITPPDLDDYQAQFYERAAIAEHDGNQPRELAEREALGEVLETYGRQGVRDQVRCSACRHFEPDPIGCGGIGSCRVSGEGTGRRSLPLYPNARRFCRDLEEGAQGSDEVLQ